jgi:sphingomyelin phosphodiesterase acid-like 3
MSQLSRRTFLEIASLASAGLIGGCGGASSITGSDNFPVLVFSDVHFQPYIAPFQPGGTALNANSIQLNTALVTALVAADTSEWPAIFEGALNSSNYPPSLPGTDTNYALLALALASIKENLGACPAVIFTGDFLGHGLYQLYTQYMVGAQPGDATIFVDKTLTFVLQQIRAAVGAVPVYFALGNCDSYTGYGPDSSFLSNNAQQLSALALNGAGNQQAVTTITNGGYYVVEPAGMNLVIIGLNTFALSASGAIVPNLIPDQFAWFDNQLATASSAGKKVWLLMHAPPGAIESSTAAPANLNANGQITTASMMWTDANEAQFMGIINKYPGVITMSLAGHTHMDEFRLMSPGNALAITAGISLFFGNNPAYKIFTLDSLSLAPVDYLAVNCNTLATTVAFNDYYTFSQAYGLEGPLVTSLSGLFPALLTSSAAKTQYQGAFSSGSNTFKPITSTNWPVYWCGIGYMDEQGFFNAVNTF